MYVHEWSEWVKLLSRVQLFASPWTVAYQAPPSMGFSRQDCWRGLPFPSPGDLPNPGIEPGSPALQADALPSEPPGKPWCCWYTKASPNKKVFKVAYMTHYACEDIHKLQDFLVSIIHSFIKNKTSICVTCHAVYKWVEVCLEVISVVDFIYYYYILL